MPSVGKDSQIVVGMQNDMATLENNLAISCRVQYIPTIYPSRSISTRLLKIKHLSIQRPI